MAVSRAEEDNRARKGSKFPATTVSEMYRKRFDTSWWEINLKVRIRLLARLSVGKSGCRISRDMRKRTCKACSTESIGGIIKSLGLEYGSEQGWIAHFSSNEGERQIHAHTSTFHPL